MRYVGEAVCFNLGFLSRQDDVAEHVNQDVLELVDEQINNPIALVVSDEVFTPIFNIFVYSDILLDK